MKSIIVFWIILFCNQLVVAQKKEICFSFDDMPVVNYGITDTLYQQKLINNLIVSLTKYHIPAIGFVNEKKLYGTDGSLIHFQFEILKSWVENGLELGNHTFSHPDYNNVSFSEYSENIIKGGTITKAILAEKGKSLCYFRHPFLHSGNNKEKADLLSDFLKERGYLVAPVTIDNDDYLFALAYKRASVKNDTSLMHQIRVEFIDYIGKKADYYEKQSQVLFGRSIPQILLLHANLLNSDCVGLLASMFEKKNYIFIHLSEVLKDKVYEIPVTVYGNMGISWIDRWALSQGKKGDFFKDDPVTPDYIKKMAE